jgi:RimJ/RimL family protein N-acetyltransferase
VGMWGEKAAMKERVGWDVQTMSSVFAGLDEHLAVEAVLRGVATGRVWTDATAAPMTGVIWVQHRVFLAGADATALNGVVREIAGAARERGDWGVGLYAPQGVDWERVLHGLVWRRTEREYWEIDAAEWQQRTTEMAAGGLVLRAVDAKLVAEAGLGRLEQLREEMCSERVSVEDFLAHSFGVCLVDEGKGALAGWCLSEYNCGGRCEVGIEVVEEYQRRGLGTLLAQALCAEAFVQYRMARVGWHCLAANGASGATARRAGLRLMKRYAGAVVLLREG